MLTFAISFAFDLVEVFFQIVHTRLPLLNPAQFRARLQYGLQSVSPYAPADQNQTSNGYQPGQNPNQKQLHNA